MKLNQTKLISVENWWNEICGIEKWEKPQEKPTQTRFVHQNIAHRGTEIRTRDASGGRRVTNPLHHEAAIHRNIRLIIRDVCLYEF